MLQSSGLGNSLNALTSLLMPYQIPVLMVVSMRGDSGEWNAAQVPMGRAVRGIFDAIGVPHATVESADAAAETVRLAGNDRVRHADARRLSAAAEVTTSESGDRRRVDA